MYKKVYISVVLLILGWYFVIANPVSEEHALEFAGNFISSFSENSAACSVDSIFTFPDKQLQGLYLIRLKPAGWLLISSDDVVQPVLGYSFDTPFSGLETLNESILSWLKNYALQITCQASEKESSQHPLWDLNNMGNISNNKKAVSPLIDVTWDQGGGWNRYCPSDENGPDGHAYVGCVAVAMAQVMSYYNYPEHSVGNYHYTHSTYGYISVNFNQDGFYDWPHISTGISDTINAKLLYHAAVSVEMDFGPDGSGTQTSYTRSALVNYFKYPTGVMEYEARYDDDEEWKTLLRSVLDQGIPIIYDGDANDDKAGHAFNIDGYQGDYFHLNWGWSGYYNGYFTINNLTPGTHNFTSNQNAMLNIRPPKPGPKDIMLSGTTVKENMPVGTPVGVISVEDEVEDNIYSYSLGFPIILKETNDLYFTLSGDTVKTKQVFNRNEQRELSLYITVTDQYNNTLSKEFIITILNDVTALNTQELTGIDIYPNPAENILFIENLPVTQSQITLVIYNISGIPVFEKTFDSLTDTIQTIDLSKLKPGLYNIILQSEGQKQYKSIVIL